MQKTVGQINEEVKNGGSVVVTAASDPQPVPAASPAAVDVVTSATLAKNVYLPPMPVMFPPQPKKE